MGEFKKRTDQNSADCRERGPDDRSFLSDAVYFKGDWTEKFDPSETKDKEFHSPNKRQKENPPDASKREIPLFRKLISFRRIDPSYGEDGQTVFHFFSRVGIKLKDLLELSARPKLSPGQVTLPGQSAGIEYAEFKQNTARSHQTLKALGMGIAFQPRKGRFQRNVPSAIPSEEMSISVDILQKTFLGNE